METLPDKSGPRRKTAYFIILHPLTGLNPRLVATEQILERLGANPPLVVRPEDYKDPAFFGSVEDKDRFSAAFVSFNGDVELSAALLHFRNIEWVQGLGTGLDRLLQVPALKNERIQLTNMRSVSCELLGEFALMGSLYFAKRVREYLDLMERRQWKESFLYNVEALAGKRALVVGLGTIGGDIALKCRLGFHMRVAGVRRQSGEVPANLSGVVERVFGLDELAVAVADADFIYVALPIVKDRPMIFDARVFKAMKRGAVFVNVGRGSYVDEAALIDSLRDGTLTGAALDVSAQEPLPKDSPLYGEDLRDRVLLTCHSMDHSPYFLQKNDQLLEENISRYLDGLPLERVVDKEFGY